MEDKNKEKTKVNFNLPAKELIDQPIIKESFISTLMKIHGKNEADASMIFEREALYYKKALSANPWLSECTGISLYSAFLEIAITGLSMQPGNKAESYLEARSTKLGNENGKDIWGKVASLCITAYGELNMRIMAGQIVRMANPQVIYEGDKFQPRTNEMGVLIVDYQPCIPRKSQKIIGCYVCIALPKGGYDFKWLLEDDIVRLANYSKPKATQNNPNPKASALYESNNGQIDPGFLEAKTIKHAMRAYTKLRVGDSVSFEGDEEFIEDAAQPFNPINAPSSTSNTADHAPVSVVGDESDIW